MRQIEKLLEKDVQEKESLHKLLEIIDTAAEKACEITH